MSASRLRGNQPPTRRGFLDAFVALCSAIAGAAMALPALMYLWPAAKGGGSENVEVEDAKSIAVGSAKMVQIGGQAAVVVRQKTGVKAFSASCTHLGCLVKWDSGKGQFLCPCHAAVFDENGGVVSGPPPAPLKAFKVKEVGDKVFVSVG